MSINTQPDTMQSMNLRGLLKGRCIHVVKSPHSVLVKVSPIIQHTPSHQMDYYEDLIQRSSGAAIVREALMLSSLYGATITLELYPQNNNVNDN